MMTGRQIEKLAVMGSSEQLLALILKVLLDIRDQQTVYEPEEPER